MFTVLLLYFFAYFSKEYAVFREDSVTWGTEESIISVRITEEKYSGIENIYFCRGLYNDFGDYIARSHYIITFRDGEMLNLDAYTSTKKTEKYVLPVIEKYCGGIVEVEDSGKIPD